MAVPELEGSFAQRKMRPPLPERMYNSTGTRAAAESNRPVCFGEGELHCIVPVRARTPLLPSHWLLHGVRMCRLSKGVATLLWMALIGLTLIAMGIKIPLG